MVNLADQDTSFLVPCRHCGELLPEHDRICPHCGKDQSAVPAKGGTGAGSTGSPSGGADAPDPFMATRDVNDVPGAGLGPSTADDDAGRRRLKVVGVVALLAGVLLLGMAYDRHAKERAAASPATLAQEAPAAVAAPPTVAPPTSTPAPAPAPARASAPPAAPVATDTPPSGCNEALAAMSLCAKP